MADVEPYWQRIRRLRAEKGMSHGELFRACEEIGYETLRRIQRNPGEHGGTNGNARYPSMHTLAVVARGLGVEPTDFPEFRLAVARSRLDERCVGLEDALKALEGNRPHTMTWTITGDAKTLGAQSNG